MTTAGALGDTTASTGDGLAIAVMVGVTVSVKVGVAVADRVAVQHDQLRSKFKKRKRGVMAHIKNRAPSRF